MKIMAPTGSNTLVALCLGDECTQCVNTTVGPSTPGQAPSPSVFGTTKSASDPYEGTRGQMDHRREEKCSGIGARGAARTKYV